ncbi:MAG: DUF4058 family protein [Acaryochloridaceae cyanobacterium RU_4_10]|nr:DUF4058 family protein [Acaryochloridaceae cyanobacterium RU_4_10]
MPSPFPVMDPHLENSAFWSAVHSRLIVAIALQNRHNRKMPGVFSDKVSTDV